MPAPQHISIVVAEWLKTTIEARIGAGDFTTATVQRCNSFKVARELLTTDMQVFIVPIDDDPQPLRGDNYTENETVHLVVVGKKITNSQDNTQSDPVINQVGAIFTWLHLNSDHTVDTGKRRFNPEKSELISLLDDSLLNDQLIAVGGFAAAFVEDYLPED